MFAIIVWLIIAGLCYIVAENKGRNAVGWFIGGIALGFVAFIVLLLLPSLEDDINKE